MNINILKVYIPNFTGKGPGMEFIEKIKTHFLLYMCIVLNFFYKYSFILNLKTITIICIFDKKLSQGYKIKWK